MPPTSTAPSDPTVVHGYDRIAPVYDLLATLYSGGRIDRCHRAIAARLRPGERALFVGVGSGRDAAAAATRGVDPILLVSSPAMLARAKRRIARATSPERADSIETHAVDARTFSPPAPIDAIVASFFLNVFRTDELDGLIARLRGWLPAGGRLLIADFAPPRGGALARGAQRIYHDLPMHAFRALTGNARHAIHDLPPRLTAHGFSIVERQSLRVFGIGPRWLEVLEARVEAPSRESVSGADR